MAKLLNLAMTCAVLVCISACVTASEPAPVSTPTAQLHVETPGQCRVAGGSWSRGAFGQRLCQVQFSDAYKICHDGSECLSGKCRWEKLALFADCQGANCPKYPADASHGLCGRWRYDPGCFSVFKAGRRLPEICED